MFLVTVTTMNGPVLFHARTLEADKGLPGHLVASGITNFPVKLADKSTFMTNIFSFRASDLDSYMVGLLAEEGPQDVLVAPVAPPEPPPAAEPVAQPTSESAEQKTEAPAASAPPPVKAARRTTPNFPPRKAKS